jgi:HAD superfamily hydrolase (TIGR01549 family)
MTSAGRPPLTWVAFDVGETLIDETRIWGIWADVLGVPRLTLGAALGAVIERGRPFQSMFDLVGAPDWRTHSADVERRFGGFEAVDLYPDARRSMAALRERGLRLAVVANQPASRTAELRAIGVDADVITMSGEIGVHKPDPSFYAETLRLLGDPEPATVAYVGDRVDNDVLPAHAAGLRAVWVRRGPWGRIQSLPAPDAADLVVDNLDELVTRIDDL